MTYAADLPQISVVFIFVNEALSVILRSVHSVVNRTPSRLLKEVILVDDNSDSGEWGPAGHPDSTGRLESGWAGRTPGGPTGSSPSRPALGTAGALHAPARAASLPRCLVFTRRPRVHLLLCGHLLLDEAHPKSKDFICDPSPVTSAKTLL